MSEKDISYIGETNDFSLIFLVADFLTYSLLAHATLWTSAESAPRFAQAWSQTAFLRSTLKLRYPEDILTTYAMLVPFLILPRGAQVERKSEAKT